MRTLRCAFLAVSLLGIAPAAQAALSVAPVIVDLQPGDPPRTDVELFNDGAETIYVVVQPSKIESPGETGETRVQDRDPQSLGLLATPNRLVLQPGERKFMRIALLSPAGDADRVWRVTVKPVVGDVKSGETGLKILIGYDMLVIQRPARPNAAIVAARTGSALTLTNTGNTNAELFQGQQCDGAKHCTSLPGHRLYAGTSWSVPIQPGLAVDYAVKVGPKIATQHF
jgi:P pilus assembly chaperone PapD